MLKIRAIQGLLVNIFGKLAIALIIMLIFNFESVSQLLIRTSYI